MKVTVVSTPVFPCPPPGYSGLEHLAWLQAEGLAKRGHEVTLVAPDGSWAEHAKVLPTGPAGQHDEHMAYQKYWQHLLGADVVVDNSWQKHSYLLKAEGVLKAPVLGVMHAPVNTMYQTLPPVEKPCFVCISKDQANHFEALFDREARYAYNGVDPDYYKPIYGVPRTDRFLFLARFSSIKGADLAIQACKEAGVGLDLVGDTSITHEPDYFERCKAQCDGDQIRMVGPATRGECVRWFTQAHALLHPNQRFREPFGLAPVEAMLCGCPVIAWRYGAMKETVWAREVNLVGSYEELVDQIKFYSSTPAALSSRDRELCREHALQFSVENMVSRYEELCKEALETGGW
jgi:glycosyltransferase involved in cell wall biosynthesis